MFQANTKSIIYIEINKNHFLVASIKFNIYYSFIIITVEL